MRTMTLVLIFLPKPRECPKNYWEYINCNTNYLSDISIVHEFDKFYDNQEFIYLNSSVFHTYQKIEAAVL